MEGKEAKKAKRAELGKIFLGCGVLLSLASFLLPVAFLSLSSRSTDLGEPISYEAADDSDDDEDDGSSDICQTDLYQSYYYSNLTNNYGNNVKSSCGYTALGMLLSYWDTYWDDSFIPESYDEISSIQANYISSSSDESPGTKREPDSLVYSGIGNQDYYDVIGDYSGIYHHLNLIRIGDGTFDYAAKGAPSEYSVNYDELYDVAEYYLYQEMGFSEDDVTVKGHLDEGLGARDFAIRMVKHGIPTILFVGYSFGSGTGHVVVAYDYDSSSDTLYVHSGWSSKPTHTTLEYLHRTNCRASFAIIPSTEHSHTDNYVYSSDGSSVTHCTCELGLTDFRDSHDYTYSYDDYSSSKHKAYCICGGYKLSSHLYGDSYKIGVKTYAKCTYCGHMADLTKDATPYN